MDALDLLLHTGAFVAPAVVVALLLAPLGRLCLPARGPQALGWGRQALLDTVVGLLVLGGGLLLWGRDGKMATYAALVLCCATAHWLGQRGWRG
ncbi:hypothetical protein [Acidovorax lacteus]|uniref:Uncharacterized protein n=1 Tax=Acidovorax lacteus TaxID=1924988 RepID=A0ABP8L8K5_9BURK